MRRSFLKSPPTGTSIAYVGLVLAMAATAASGQGRTRSEFQRVLTVANAEPVMLRVEISSGDVEVAYSREGQVTISGFAQADGDVRLDDTYFRAFLSIDQVGSRITVHRNSDSDEAHHGIKVRYRIDVPYRTQVISQVDRGRQTIRGILGPATISAGMGDIKASYVSKALQVKTETGNVELQVIGERVHATTGRGNISGERLAQGIDAKTGDGDINLVVVGSSVAAVEEGNGRIEVGGARGTLTCSTDSGDLHVQAVPHGDWNLNSASGTIRLDLPPTVSFDLEASTDTGDFQLERDDLSKPPSNLQRIAQRVGRDGKHIGVRTGSGRIVVR